MSEALLNQNKNKQAEAADGRFSLYQKLQEEAQNRPLVTELSVAMDYFVHLPETQAQAARARLVVGAYSPSDWALHDHAQSDLEKRQYAIIERLKGEAGSYSDRAAVVRRTGERAAQFLLAQTESMTNVGSHSYWAHRDLASQTEWLVTSDDNAEALIYFGRTIGVNQAEIENGSRIATVEDYGRLVMDVHTLVTAASEAA